MSDAEYLRNQLLIAMPSMADSNFTKGVTYVCQHNDEGALGLVINHPSGLTLGELLQQLDYDTEDHQQGWGMWFMHRFEAPPLKKENWGDTRTEAGDLWAGGSGER